MADDVVRQGELHWVDMGDPFGSEPGYRRPYLVIQNDLFNLSPIGTVLACPLTTNLRLARAPGNVLIPAGPSGLSRDSVVDVSRVTALDRARFGDYIGRIPMAQLRQAVQGLKLLIEPSV